MFPGLRHDIIDRYTAMDRFVLVASHREGFSRSAIETAAMGSRS